MTQSYAEFHSFSKTEFTMFRQYHIGGGLLLLILSASAQAGPLINVISDHLQLTSYAKLIDGDGTQHIWEESYTGKVMAGDRMVTAYNDLIYSEMDSDCCGLIYDEVAVTALSRSTWESHSFGLFARSDYYPMNMGNDLATPPETYFTSVELGALASVEWRFEVSGGDVELSYWVGDDHRPEMTDYPPGWTKSLSSITVFDETGGVEILNAAGNSSNWINLLDGHTYSLYAIARDDHSPSSLMNEENVYTGIVLGAEVVYLPEPPVDALIALGLLSLVAGRRLGGRLSGGFQ
jgi:hypothetical protein